MKDAPDYWVHHFEPFTITHACVVAAFLILVSAMIALRRRDEVALVPPVRRTLDRAVGWMGLTVAIGVQVATLWPSRFNHWTSLPLYVCDIVMFVAPLSLLLDWRPLRAIAYFWGLGISSISFILPDLRFGPGDFQFWVFWAGHAVIVGTALYDVTARGFRPRWRDWLLAAICGVAYVLILFPVDAYFHLNYGYIGITYKQQRSPVEVLGPWPGRVPLMLVSALGVMLLLLVPWSIRRFYLRHRIRPDAPSAGLDQTASSQG